MSHNSSPIIQLLIKKTQWFEVFNPNVYKIFVIQNKHYSHYEML